MERELKPMTNKYWQEWDRLRTCGVPLLDSCTAHDGIAIEYSPAESMLIMLESGATAYVLHVGVTKTNSGPFFVSSWELELPWPDPNFRWLEETASHRYFVPGTSIEYPRQEVLNHRTGARGSLNLPLKGLLLAMGYASVPRTFLGFRVPLRLSVCGTEGRCASQTMEVLIDSAAARGGLPRRPPNYRGLFEGSESRPQKATPTDDKCPDVLTGQELPIPGRVLK